MLKSFLFLAFAFSVAVGERTMDDSYQLEIEQWRAKREEGLKAFDGWLALTDMNWLKEGDNRWGTAADNAIVLPPGSTLEHAGLIHVSQKGVKATALVSLEASADAHVTVNEMPVTQMTFNLDLGKKDANAKENVIVNNRLHLQLVRRNERMALRVRDRESPTLRAFQGCRWLPISSEYRVQAQFTAYEPYRPVRISNSKGEETNAQIVGYAEFSLKGKPFRLEAMEDSPDELFFVFKDLTSKSTTYPPGRFLTTELPQDGKVTLDFNKAYNPPCAFSSFTLCPRPTEKNVIDMAIEAGELRPQK